MPSDQVKNCDFATNCQPLNANDRHSTTFRPHVVERKSEDC
jgi:hypothetical protein